MKHETREGDRPRTSDRENVGERDQDREEKGKMHLMGSSYRI